MAGQVDTRAVHGWEIERKGIDWISDNERHGTPRSQFWPWTAANFSFFTVAYGVFVISLGLTWWQGIIAVLLGLALSYPIVGMVSLAGMRGSAPTMTLSRAPFGYHGNKLPTVFVYLSLVGWEIVSVALGALATQTIMQRLDKGLPSTPTLAAGFAITVVLVVVVAIYGYDVIIRVQKWITVAVAVMTIAYFAIVIPKLSFTNGTAGKSGGVLVLIGGITLVIANGIGWTSGGADYSRYTPRVYSPRSVAAWTTVGGAAAPTVLMLFGILLTAGDSKLATAAANDPIGAFAVRLPTWFLVPFLITTLLSVVSGAVFNLYSSGLNLLALGVRVPRWAAVGIDSVLMIVGGIYLVFITPSFFAPVQAFLVVIGVVTAGWSAVFLVDMFLYRKAGYQKESLYTPHGAYRRWNPAGVAALVVSIAVGLGLVTSSDPHIRLALGYLMTTAAANGGIGASDIGVAVAFLVAGVLYPALSSVSRRSAAVEPHVADQAADTGAADPVSE